MQKLYVVTKESYNTNPQELRVVVDMIIGREHVDRMEYFEEHYGSDDYVAMPIDDNTYHHAAIGEGLTVTDLDLLEDSD